MTTFRRPHLLASLALAAIGLLMISTAPVAGQGLEPEDLELIDEGSSLSTGELYHYENLTTPLGGRYYIADVLTPDNEWRTWDGNPTSVFDLDEQTSENYDSEHNHYQTLLVDLTNTQPHANGIPFWSNAAAVTDGALAWGGFMSARSTCSRAAVANIDSSIPTSATESGACPDDFDAQLIGLEVDVLNEGKPGVFGNEAKHGLQVVGFGNPNSHAISVIAHGFDLPEGQQNGQFETLLYSQKSLHPDYGRLIVSDQATAMLGLDLDQTVFTDGAITIKSQNIGQGIRFNDIAGGEIFAGQRWPAQEYAESEWFSVRSARDGLRLVSTDATTEFLVWDESGTLTVNADLIVNGAISGAEQATAPAAGLFSSYTLATILAAAAFALSLGQLIWNRRRTRRSTGHLTPAGAAS
jgi:hypothetical protein